MDLLPTTITIAGTAYDEAGRVGVGLVLDSWGWDLDGDLSCEFHETGPNLGNPIAASWHPGQLVSLSTSSTPHFVGEISEVHPSFGETSWTFGYRARGPKYRANQIEVTDSDGTGTMPFNLDPRDDAYIPSLAGQTVGQILSLALSQHSTQLAAVGVSTDSTTASQLAALTLVPPTPVYLTGRLVQALESVLRDWAKNFDLLIDATGLVRVLDSTAGTPVTLTEGLDPFGPFRFTGDVTDCATRVQYRGGGNIVPFYARISKTEISQAWTTALQNAWSMPDFTQPKDAYDTGTVSTVGGPTSVTLHSGSATQAVAANFWAQREATIHLYNDVATGLLFHEARPVTANTAETAGSSFTVTLAFDLENAGSAAYSRYALIGGAATIGNSGKNDVWRLYNISDPWVSSHLVKSFPTEIPWFGYHPGEGYTKTRFPQALIVDSHGTTFPATFKIVPQTGQIRFDEPTVTTVNTSAALAAGGASVVAPSDIYVLLAYSRGPLTATSPPDSGGLPQYGGTAYSLYGLQRTLIVDLDSWVYKGNQSQMQAAADMMLASRKDVVFSGDITLPYAFTAAFSPGLKINLAGNGYTTGQESLGVPVRAFTLAYVADGSAGVLYRSTLRCSSRRNPATGERYYIHPTQLEQIGFKIPDGDLGVSAGQLAALGIGGAWSGAMAANSGAAGAALDASAAASQNLPQSPADLGLPTSVADLGLPTSAADLGLQDPTEYFASMGVNLTGRANYMRPDAPKNQAQREDEDAALAAFENG